MPDFAVEDVRHKLSAMEKRQEMGADNLVHSVWFIDFVVSLVSDGSVIAKGDVNKCSECKSGRRFGSSSSGTCE